MLCKCSEPQGKAELFTYLTGNEAEQTSFWETRKKPICFLILMEGSKVIRRHTLKGRAERDVFGLWMNLIVHSLLSENSSFQIILKTV